METSGRTLAVFVAVMALLVPASVVAREVVAPLPPADGEVVEVVYVTDGDTIRVERANGAVERVRYIGIDTPEIAHEAGDTDEPFGVEATELNAELVEDRRVLLERDVSDTDHYDRLLRYVWVETDGGWVMVNSALVANGLADVRASEPDTEHDEYLRWVEDEAVAAGTGMHQPSSASWYRGPCDVAGFVVDGCPGESEDPGLFDDILDFFFGG